MNFHFKDCFAYAELFFCRLVFATESYGGRYGPAFVTYFNEQNKLIDQGRLSGIKVEFDALLIIG